MLAFFAPSAFEQRARDRERAKLVEELNGIEKLRKLCKDREPVIVARLKVLDKADCAASLPQVSGYGQRWTHCEDFV